jgi:hypothetical protein
VVEFCFQAAFVGNLAPAIRMIVLHLRVHLCELSFQAAALGFPSLCRGIF